MTEKLIFKYLNPSPATAKGHMKRPRHGIQSTTPKLAISQLAQCINKYPIKLIPPQLSVASNNLWGEWVAPPVIPQGPNMIFDDDVDDMIANVFAFGVFTDKNSGIIYHNLKGLFLFVSLDGSMCFFILYHYELNSILAEPITGLDDRTILAAYKKQFDKLTKSGFKVKLNVMDNQAQEVHQTIPGQKQVQIATR
jgi:hypothetical protein